MNKFTYLFFIVFFSFSMVDAFATNFVDHTGYIPDWAKTKVDFSITMACIEIDYDTPDSAWCTEFSGYSLDKMMGTTKGVSFVDHTGFAPSWAKTMGQNQATSTCIYMDYFTPDSAWCTEFSGYMIDRMMGSNYVTFTDIAGYIPDWAKTMGQNQATSTCINIDYSLRDSGWCFEYDVYVLKKLTGEIDDEYYNPPAAKQSPIEKPPEIQIPKTQTIDPLEKYLTELDKINYEWEETSDQHELSDGIAGYGISKFYARGYESIDGLDVFFVAITEFTDESIVQQRADEFIDAIIEKAPNHNTSNGYWSHTNADCTQITSSPIKSIQGVSCTNQNFLLTTIAILKSDRDTSKLVESILESIDKENPTTTQFFEEKIPQKPITPPEIWSDSLIKSEDTRTIGVRTDDGSIQKVLVNVSTDKKTYNVGDDLEWTVKIQSPWQSGYSFTISDDRGNQYYDFFNDEIISSDGGGTSMVDIYLDGSSFNVDYNSGTNTVRIENFWTEDMIAGEYNLSLYLDLSQIWVERYVYFEKNRIESLEPVTKNPSDKIPSWVKNNAKWWADGIIDDDAFVSGIQFLIKEGILDIPESTGDFDESSEIPDWIKRVADFWSMDMISEDDFIMSIQFLIENGIVKIN